MVRKQLYLEAPQNEVLKRRAKELGVSEAEVVRQALGAALRGENRRSRTSQKAVASFLRRADELARTHSLPEGYRFDRQALCEEGGRFER